MTTTDSTSLRAWLGVDTGGTFTDFVLYDGNSLRIHKVLSTPQAPEQAILQGIHEMGVGRAGLQVVHGSTVATNAVLERKGVRTLYISNRGLGDVLTIGRQARQALYQLQAVPEPPPVPTEYCIEVGARIAADGTRISGLNEQDRARVLAAVRALAPEAVAINLLFSFVDDSDERTIESWLPDGLFIARSSRVLPEYKEYERGIATWLNAALGPLVAGYLARLNAALAPAPVLVMQSSATTVSAREAGGKAVQLLLSGPAGGLMGARFIARHGAGPADRSRLMTFDMGGTSTDVALLDGDIALTSEGRIGRWPVAVPMVDMHTIGAGGGSIAALDSGGLLQVGPVSAGARPGPACYGLGGDQPTVTDANLVLGRLQPQAFLGGAMSLDSVAARLVVQRIASALQLSIEAAAEGIVALANEHMAQALRVISVQRGIDPRPCTLLSFGGAGGLHVCALAEALGMTRVLVPVHAGVLSALGMLVAPRGRQLARTHAGLLDDVTALQLDAAFRTLADAGRDELVAEGVSADAIVTACSVDLRYQGQSYTLNLPWRGHAGTQAAFHDLHEQRYGHRLAAAVELVTLRCALQAAAPQLLLPELPAAGSGPPLPAQAPLAGYDAPVAVWSRRELPAGFEFTGPALVTETVATTWLPVGWQARVDAVGNLLLRYGDAA